MDIAFYLSENFDWGGLKIVLLCLYCLRPDKHQLIPERMDAIRQRTYDRKKDPEEPTKEAEKPVEKKPVEQESPRRGRQSRRRQPDKKPEEAEKPQEEEEKPVPPSRRVRPVPASLQNGDYPARNRRKWSSPRRRNDPDGTSKIIGHILISNK